MPFIRFDDNVPDVYVEESRDFQVLMRLLTLGLNGSKFEADSLSYQNSPRNINNRLLQLLQTKIGFYTNKNFQSDYLRKVASVFYALIRSKGSETAIIEAVRLFLQVYSIVTDVYIEVINDDTYEIRIGIHTSVKDISLLTEILNYIAPTGYIIKIYFYERVATLTKIFCKGYKVIVANTTGYSRSSIFDTTTGSIDTTLTHAADTTSIAPPTDDDGQTTTESGSETTITTIEGQ